MRKKNQIGKRRAKKFPFLEKQLISCEFISHSLDRTREWHLRSNLEKRLIPPWEFLKVKITKKGDSIDVRIRFWLLFKLSYTFSYRITSEGTFQILPIKGFFNRWSYQMKLVNRGSDSCEIIEQFVFKVHFLNIVSFLINCQFAKRFKRGLNYKNRVLKRDLDLLHKYQCNRPLKILITGAHGFVGSALFTFLEFIGHDVWKLSRFKNDGEQKSLVWGSQLSDQDRFAFEGFDAVFHLAGENIGTGRWTEEKKALILKSRYEGTKKLVSLLSTLKTPPRTFICASAIGYYGNRGAELLNDKSPPGEGQFLSEVCRFWESASKKIEEEGVRVVNARFGMILSSKGGVLKKMSLPFKLGIGGKIGRGDQYISWIVLDDLIAALYHVLMTPLLKGGVNFSSPYPVTNRYFASMLSKAFNRHLGPPLPAWVVRLVFGQKGRELLLSSTRAMPNKLIETGYQFQCPTLVEAFEHIL